MILIIMPPTRRRRKKIKKVWIKKADQVVPEPPNMEGVTIHLTVDEFQKLTQCTNSTDIVRILHMIPWDYTSFTKNRSSKSIANNLDLPWDEVELLGRKTARPKTLRQYSHLEWDMKKVTKNAYVYDLVLSPDIAWDPSELDKRKSEIKKYVENQKHKSLSTVENTLGDVKNFYLRFPNLKIPWKTLVKRFTPRTVVEAFGYDVDLDPYDFVNDEDDDEEDPLSIVIDHPRLRWIMERLTDESSWNSILKYRHLPWKMEELQEKSQTLASIAAFPELKADMAVLTKKVSAEDILFHPEIKWDDAALLKRKFDPRIYKRYPSLDWDLPKITKEIDWCFIKEHPDIPWDIEVINGFKIPELVFLSMPQARFWDYDKLKLQAVTPYGRKSITFIKEAREHMISDMIRIAFEYF
jgi:hypothetical protein